MNNSLARFIRTLLQAYYWMLILTPVTFLLVSLFAYYWVQYAIGEEPTTEDRVWPLAYAKHVDLHLPPHAVGLALIIAFIYSCLTFLLIIMVNSLVAWFWKPVPTYFKLAIGASLSNLLGFAIFMLFPPASWYFSFILD